MQEDPDAQAMNPLKEMPKMCATAALRQWWQANQVLANDNSRALLSIIRRIFFAVNIPVECNSGDHRKGCPFSQGKLRHR
jgi:hypothetical protein